MGQDINQPNPRIQEIRNILIDCHDNGLDYSATAEKLNAYGIYQFNGDRWSKSAVKSYVELIFGGV